MTITINPSRPALPVVAKDGGGFQAAGLASAPPPSSGGAFFEDSFESGDLSKTTTSDGSTWEWIAPALSVDSGDATDGTQSVSMVFGPDADESDSSAQLNFDFGKALSEVWVEYDLYIPSNFNHRSQASVTNNKFFQFNFDGSTYQALTIEYVEGGGGYSDLKRFLSASETPGGSINWPTDAQVNPTVENFIGVGAAYTMNPGNWYQIRVHFKSSTDGTSDDGTAELFVDGTLIKSLDWAYWNISTSGQVNGGYVLGYANSGFDSATEFRVDNFKCYDSDPGWV